MRPLIAVLVVVIMLASGLTALGLFLYQMGIFD